MFITTESIMYVKSGTSEGKLSLHGRNLMLKANSVWRRVETGDRKT